MKKIAALLTCLVFLFAAAPLVLAADAKATPEQAKALVDEAIAFYKAKGKDAVLKEVSDTHGKFVKGDLYIVIQSTNGVVLAHGPNPKLVGKNFWDTMDPDGKYFVRELVEKGKAPGGGWVDYKFTNPQTKTVQSKSSYSKIVDDLNFLCGVWK